MSYVNAIVNHHGHYHVLFEKKSTIKHTSTHLLYQKGKIFLPLPSMRTHLAFWSGLSNEISPHLWKKKKKICLVKYTVIVSPFLSSDSSVYVLKWEMLKHTL